jgi:hypothetical protein
MSALPMLRPNESRALEAGKTSKSTAPIRQAPLEAYRVDTPRSFIEAE